MTIIDPNCVPFSTHTSNMEHFRDKWYKASDKVDQIKNTLDIAEKEK